MRNSLATVLNTTPENSIDLAVSSVPAAVAGTSYTAFPDITYQEFANLPKSVREELITKNRIVVSDGYNRVMDHLLSQRETTDGQTVASAPATYSLQLRRSPFPYLVACGVEDAVERLTLVPISKAEFNFAKEYFKAQQIPFFNEEMWRHVIEDHNGMLPFEIRGVRDGTVIFPSEPLLTVTGPSELVAHFEHAFHRVFYQSLVATKARALKEILGDPSRFIEVGLRGAITDQQHLQALHAAYVGGGFAMTSNDAGSAVLPIVSRGTIGHRYVQTFKTEEEAFRFAIEHLDAVTLLIDLVESYQGIDLALRLKDEYRNTNKKIWVRLDSGDIKEQVRYYLKETRQLGLTSPERDKLVVEGIDSLQEIAEIEKMIIEEFGEAARAQVMYGAGSLLISDGTTRTDASSGFKLSSYTETDGITEDTMKFSSSPGKGSFPGAVELVEVDGARFVAQRGEDLPGIVASKFELLYHNSNIIGSRCTPEESRARCDIEFAMIPDKRRAKLSIMTSRKEALIRARYGLTSA